MLAGLEESDTAMAHAQELLEVARARRCRVVARRSAKVLIGLNPVEMRTFCETATGSPLGSTAADQARLRHRRRRLIPRQGAHRLEPGPAPPLTRAAGHHAEARPLPQRRPRHDEPVPARRGVRHQRRRRDRPRHRPLRAVPRHRPRPDRQRDDRAGLLERDRQGAARRLPRRHRPGHPAHHQRDQGPRPRHGRRGHRRGHHRGRRHRRRHRVAAVPRGRPSGAPRRRPRQRLLPARLAGPVDRSVAGAQDQAHPALRGRAALDRYPARRDRLPLRPRAPGLGEEEDLADVRRRRGGRGHRRRRPVDLRHPQGAAPRGPRRLPRTPPQPAVPRRRLDPLGRPAPAGAPPQRGGHGRSGRQVHRPARRLPLGRRGAACGRLRPRGAGQPRVDPLRRVRHPRGRRASARRPRRDLRAGRVRHPRHRGQARRADLRADPQDPDARAVSRPAVHGHRVRALAGRPRQGRLDRVRPRLPRAGDRDDGRAARLRRGRRRPRRDHAAGSLPGRPQGGHGRARGVRRGQGGGAPPPPLRGQQRLPRAARGRRHGVLRHLAGQQPGRVRGAPGRRAPLLRRHPGPPRAAVAADASAPAVRRADRRGHPATARAAHPDRRERAAASLGRRRRRRRMDEPEAAEASEKTGDPALDRA